MTARETIQTTILKLRHRSRREDTVRLSAPALALGGEAGLHFLLAAVLAGAVILGDRAPFPTALVAAAGPGLCGAAALLGAAAGSLALLPFSAAMRYLSASILTYAVAFAFYDLKPIRRLWAMPATAGAMIFFTGFLVESQRGWRPGAQVGLALEVALTVLAAGACREALAGGDSFPLRRKLGVLGLAALLLLSLDTLEPLGGLLNPGRVLSVLALVCCGRQGGPAAGTAAGAFFGLAADLAEGGLPVRGGVFSLCGLAAGLGRGQPKIHSVFFSSAVFPLAALWLWEQPQSLPLLWEGLVGASLVFCVPEAFLRKLSVCLAGEEGFPSDLHARDLVKTRLEATAGAFRSLEDSLRSAFRPHDNDNDIATVFDRAANRACRTCALRDRCWQQDYTSTFNALNDATAPMVERGRAEPTDFPTHFADRCIHFGAFVATVNEELTALFYRRQYNARIRESRTAVCRQYAQLSDLLGSAAQELGEELTPDRFSDKLVRRRMAELGLEVRTAVFRDGRGLLRLQAEGPAVKELSRSSRIADLSRLLDAPLRVEYQGKSSLSLLQEEPLMAVAGVAAKKKSGETVSGDSGTYFKRPDGKLYLLLCDGMGTGPEANRESALAVRLLEQFLLAGVDTGHALTTLASALALRGEETGGFTTVDLLQVDLFTGDSRLYKLGAAPTYVKNKAQVKRLIGSSLPAGLAQGTEAAIDSFSFHLDPGDCVLMVSDGVCTALEDSWVQEQFRAFDGGSPRELARTLITDCPGSTPDDRTALVIRLEERRPG